MPIAPTSPTTARSTGRVPIGKVPWKDTVAPYGATSRPTAMFPDGPVKITATAFDKTGNSRTTSVDVIFDNTAPVIGATGPDRRPSRPVDPDLDDDRPRRDVDV